MEQSRLRSWSVLHLILCLLYPCWVWWNRNFVWEQNFVWEDGRSCSAFQLNTWWYMMQHAQFCKPVIMIMDLVKENIRHSDSEKKCTAGAFKEERDPVLKCLKPLMLIYSIAPPHPGDWRPVAFLLPPPPLYSVTFRLVACFLDLYCTGTFCPEVGFTQSIFFVASSLAILTFFFYLVARCYFKIYSKWLKSLYTVCGIFGVCVFFFCFF